MKKVFGVLFIVLTFAMLAFPQGIVGVKSYNLGTIANTVWESYTAETWDGLLKQFGCAKIDSLIISMTLVGEADVDTLDWYPCNWTSNGTAVNGAVKTFTVTLNIAAASTGTERLFVSNAGAASTLWRGYEGFRFRTRGAAAGNDPTDPNNCKVTITFYGS